MDAILYGGVRTCSLDFVTLMLEPEDFILKKKTPEESIVIQSYDDSELP